MLDITTADTSLGKGCHQAEFRIEGAVGTDTKAAPGGKASFTGSQEWWQLLCSYCHRSPSVRCVSPAGLGTLGHRIAKAARGSGFSPSQMGGGEAGGADRSELIPAEGAKCRLQAPSGPPPPPPFTACGLLTYPLQPRAPHWLPIAK